jgi:hypothetical protein
MVAPIYCVFPSSRKEFPNGASQLREELAKWREKYGNGVYLIRYENDKVVAEYKSRGDFAKPVPKRIPPNSRVIFWFENEAIGDGRVKKSGFWKEDKAFPYYVDFGSSIRWYPPGCLAEGVFRKVTRSKSNPKGKGVGRAYTQMTKEEYSKLMVVVTKSVLDYLEKFVRI